MKSFPNGLRDIVISLQLALILHCVYQSVKANSYCTLCENHVACHNTGALGEIPKYYTAAKMPALVKDYRFQIVQKFELNSEYFHYSQKWDRELSHLAELNARSCIRKNDQCMQTEKYPLASQIHMLRGAKGGYPDTNITITRIIRGWFSKYEDANMTYINSFRSNPRKNIHHFTLMVNDKNSAVGCAMVRHQGDEYKNLYFVCNYGYKNIVGEEVYESGQPASKCYQRHSNYRGLCDIEGEVSLTKEEAIIFRSNEDTDDEFPVTTANAVIHQENISLSENANFNPDTNFYTDIDTDNETLAIFVVNRQSNLALPISSPQKYVHIFHSVVLLILKKLLAS